MTWTTRNREALRGYSPDGRHYHLADKRYWSVTSIISAGSPMPQWTGKKLVDEYLVPHWDEAVEMRGRMSDEEFSRFLRGKPWSAARSAADIGTVIHDRIEAAILGGPLPDLPDDPVVGGMVAAFDDFVQMVRPEWWAAEAVVVNDTIGYAGTLDAIARIDGGLVVVDFKTGRGVYDSAALQVAALRHAEYLVAGDPNRSPEFHPMPETTGGFVLHLRPEGWAWYDVTHEDAWGTFLAVMDVARWKQATRGWPDRPVKRGRLG